jgi:biotin carboxyl carrier protein
MRYLVTIGGTPHTLTIERGDDRRWQVLLDDTPLEVDSAQLAAGRLSLIVGGQSYEAFVRETPADSSDARAFDVLLDGAPFPVELVDERRRALSSMARGTRAAGEAVVKAPMPGLVAKVLVSPGDAVAHNQVVVVLEAMKMQNDLVAPRAGVVRDVTVEAGQAVAQSQPLVIIGDADDGSSRDRDTNEEN